MTDALHQLRFRVETSIDYHDLRRDWFARVSSTTSAGIIIAAVLCIVWSEVASAAAAALVFFSMWADVGDKISHHVIQRSRYGDVAALMATKVEPTQEQVAEWMARVVVIEKDEVTLHHVIWAKCYNWHSIRIGSDAPRFRFTLWEKLTGHIFKHDAESLERRRLSS